MKRIQKTNRLLPVAAAIAIAFPLPGNAAAISWSAAGSGFWDVPANWSAGIPGDLDDVTVSIAGINTITYRQDTRTIQSLLFTGTNTLAITGGALTVTGAYSNTSATNITNGRLTLNGASSLASLTQSNGSIAGTGTVTISGPSNITFGDHRGTGTTQFNGDVSIGTSGFRLDGGRTVNLGDGGNAPTLTWTSGQILFNNTTDGQGRTIGNDTINIAAGATFIASGASANTITSSGASGADTDTGANSRFNNAGTLSRQGAVGTTTIDVVFSSTGSVDVQTGVLAFAQNSTFTGGSIGGAGRISFGGSAGTVHSISNTTTFNPANVTVSNGTVNVAGNYNVAGDTAVSGGVLNLNGTVSSLGTSLTISGGLLNLNALTASAGSLTQSSGSIGGTGALTITGASNITFGDHRGTGTTQFNGDVAISSSGFRLDGGRVVNLGNGGNAPTLTWTSGQILFNNTVNGQSGGPGSGTINVLGGATFIAQGNGASSILASNFSVTDTGADSLITNAGTFRKAGSGVADVTTVDVRFTSTGAVDVQTGVLNFTRDTTFTGGSIGGAGRVAFGGSGTTHDVSAATTFNPGNVSVSGGTVNIAGNYNVAGDTAVSGGVLNLNGTVSSLGTSLTISGGLLNLNALTASTGSLAQSSGSIGGTGALTITGASNITFGDHRGTGTTQFNGDVAISSSGFRLDGGRVVNLGNGGNAPTLTWTSGQILFNNTVNGQSGGPGSGTINVLGGATFIAQGNGAATISSSSFGVTDTGADSLITNAGTFRKAGSGVADVTTVDVRFTSTGAVDVQTGVLNFTRGTTFTGGSIGGAGRVGFGGSGTTHDVSAATVFNPGNVSVSDGTVNIAGDYSVSGNTAVSGGVLNLNGTVSSLGTSLTISGGLLNLNALTASTGSLSQSGGSIGGTGALTITGASNITFGDHRGTGTTQFNGDVAISSSGVRLDGGRVVNLGNGGNAPTLTWTSGQILFNNTFNGQSGGPGSGTINVRQGATFIAQGNSASSITFSNFGGTDTGADALFSNAGTFRKQGSSSTDVTTISTNFENTGTVDVLTGILSIDGPTGTLSGSQIVAGGATLRFSGAGTATLSAGSTTGTGTLQVASGTVDMLAGHTNAGTLALSVTGGQLNLAGARTFATLTQSQGSIGGTGTVAIAGASNITFGDHRGTGTTQFNGDVAISSSGFRLDGGRVVNLGNGGNAPTLTWTGGQILFNNTFNGVSGGPGSGTINVRQGATFIAQGNSASSITFSNFGGTDTGADALFSNAGTFRKQGSSSTDVTTISTNFENTGTVDVLTGILSIDGPTGTLSGSQIVAGGATLRFSGAGTATLSAGSTTGTGTLQVASGTVDMLAGHTNSGALALSVTSGQLNIGGARTFATLTQSQGSIGGTGTVTIAGASNITFGDHRGTGTTQFNGDVAISSSGFRLDGGRVVNLGNGGNAPTLTWTSGQILFNNTFNGQSGGPGSGTFNVRQGATFIAEGNGSTSVNASNFGAGDTGADAVFSNAGIFRKSGSAANSTTTIDVAFANTGTIDALTGIISLSNDSTQAGTISIASGAAVQVSGGTHAFTAGTTAGAGTLRVAGGLAVFDSPYTIDSAFGQTSGGVGGTALLTINGASDITFGDHRGTGTTQFNGDVAISSSGFRLDAGRIVNVGNGSNGTTATWTSGQILFNNTFNGVNSGPGSGTINVRSGATFIAQGNGSTSINASNFAGDTGADAAFNNAGIFRKAGSAANSTTSVDVAFANTGTIDALTGIISFSLASTQAGTISIASGAAVQLPSGTHVFTAGSTTGAGTLRVSGGVAVFDSAYTIGSAFAQTQGSVRGTGLLTVEGPSDLLFGDHSGTGTTRFAGNVGISSSGFRLDGGRSLEFGTGANSQVTTWSSGQLVFNNTFNGQSGGPGSGTITVRQGATFIAEGNSAVTISTSNFGAGDTGSDALFSNAGTFRKAGSANNSTTTVDVAFANTGTVDAQTGIIDFSRGLTGNGTLQTAGTATVRINAASTVGTLLHNSSAASTLDLRTFNLSVTGDYNNANFGSGNAFNRRANVTGAGQLLATGGAALTLAGTNAPGATFGGGTAGTGATLTIGNVRVGGTTIAYRIGNAGTETSLRGAIQTAGTTTGPVAGTALINDARLSGPGIVAGNFGPVAAGGNSGDLGVTFTVNTVGNYAAMSGQRVNIVSNFDNVTSTALTINASGAAFNPAAAGAVTPSPVLLANQRVGGALNQALTISNTAPVDNAFTERLNASFGANTGNAINNGGAITGGTVGGLAGGASNSVALTAGVDTSAPGARAGTVTINFQSNGEGTSGLLPLDLPSQVLNVSGNVYRVAQPALPASVNLGNFRAVSGAAAQAFTVTNTDNAPAGFQEALNASAGATTGGVTLSGVINLLGQGASSNAMSVGFAAGGAAGDRAGSATLNLVTDGTGTSGLGQLALAGQQIAVSGTAYALAQPSLPASPINLGNFRVGAAPGQAINITNTTVAAGFQEGLDVAAGGTTGTVTISGAPITNLAAGSSSNAITLRLLALAAGNNTGTATLNLASNGSGTSGLGTLALPSAQITLNATGWNLAQAGAIAPAPVVLGNQRIGGALTQALTVSNIAPTSAFTEGLNASFGANTGNALNNGGAVSLLAGGASNNSNLVARLDTSAAGARSGSVTVNLVSDGTVSTLGNTNLTSQVINVSGNVYQVAQPTTVGAVNLGNVRAGTNASQSVSISNTLAAPVGFQEGLDVAIGALTGNATGTGSIANLGAGSSSSDLSLGLSNVTAGNNSGTVTLDRTSNGTVSGLANLALAGQPVTVSAVGWRLAQANAIAPVSFGSVRVGGTASQALAVTNTAANDGFSERLNASASTASAGLSASGSFNLLSPNGTNNSSLVVGMNTATAGARNGTVAVALVSDGAGTSSLGQTPLSTQNVGVSGNVFQIAQPTLSTTNVNLGNFRAGTAQSQAVTISNPLNNAQAQFQEGLNATAGATTGQATISGAPIVNLGAGAAGSNAISVGVSGVAGVNSGTATIQFASNGTGTSGLSDLALASQVVNVSGTGYRLAQAGTVAPINFGNVLRNSSQERFVTISNTAIADGFSEGLDASFGTFGGGSAALLSGVGSVSNLAAGGSNGSEMRVVLNTANTGALAAGTTATLSFVSNGAALGLGTTALGNQVISVTGEIIANVGDLAQASAATPNPVNFGSFRVGAGAPANVALSISNTGTGAGEGLNASIATASSGFSASGSFTGLGRPATDNTSLVVGFSDTATAGAKSGTATITLASDGTFNLVNGNPVATPLGTQVVGLNANVYQVAQPTLPSTVNFGNFRVGSAPAAQTVTIGNTLIAPAGFQEGLDASIGALTGAATASGGPIANLAAGSTSNAISVGITGVAGLNNGAVAVNLASNGTGTSGLPTLGLSAGSINVSGQGFVAAAGTLNTAALNFGTVQVGQSVSQVLSITNSASGPAGFVEDLAAAFGTSTDARISGTGSISGLLGGQTNAAAMTVSVNTAAAGAVNGSIAVNYTSQGAVNGVTNGLGTLAVGSSSFGVVGTINANVVNTAAPVINTAQPISLGNLRQGSVAPTATVSVTNQLTTAPQADLNATIAGNGNVTGAGSFTLLAPGATNASALSVGLANTNTAGVNAGNATISFVSDATNIGNCAPNCQFALPSQNVAVTANVYRLANPTVNSGPIVLAARVGGVASQAVSISNTSVDAFTEGLNVSRTGTAAGFSSAGSISNLAAQGTDAAAITVALNTAAAGSFAGNLGLGFVSTGAGTTGAADIGVGSADVSLTGRVYTPAVASVAPSVNFGIVRVGDVVAQRGVSVANSAAVTALNDTLSASIGGTAGVFTNNGGNVNGLVAGAGANTSALTVGLNTASAGVFNGSATVAASSRNPDLADLSLGTSNVVLTGQVNNLAQAAFRQVGGAGVFSEQAGNAFTLDFGDIAQGAILTARLAAWNRAPVGEPSDDLRGSYSGADDTVALSFSGFNAFAQLGTDQTGPELLVNLFNTANLGLFTQTILLSGFSFNAFDLDGLGTNATLFVRANVIDGGGTSVIPLPPAGWLLLGGLAMMGWMGRRRSVA